MNWLTPSITATLIGTALLAFVYLYLYIHDKRKYLLVWSVSWAIYFLRYIFMLFIVAGYKSLFLTTANQTASLASGVVLLWGTYLFIDRRFPQPWIYGSVGGFLWIIVSNMLGLSFLLTTAPTFVFLALVYIWTGVRFIKSDITGACAKHITGWTFILWGIHKADYPFLRPVTWFAPAGYLIGASFEFTVALGMLLVYFHKIRVELQQEQHLLERAQEIGSIGTWALNTRTNELLWTDEAYKIFGVPTGTKLTYESFISCVHPEDRVYVDRAWKLSLKKQPYDIEHRILVNGEVKWVQEKAELEFDENGNCLGGIGFTRDITERKRAEEERVRLISAIDQVAETIMITDRTGAIQYVNPAFEQVTGYTAEEARGRNPRFLQSGRQDEAFYREMWQTISSGNTWQGRMVNKMKDGAFYTEDVTISPIIDTTGEITDFVAVKRDVTAEIEMENRLVQAQKMEAIGTLAAGIAHDFNNILSAIMGFTEIIASDMPEDSPSRDDLEEVLNACNRAKSLVKQILVFSRQGTQDLQPLQLGRVFTDTLNMMRSSLPASIEIRQKIEPGLPAVIADPTQAHQILLNLCTNAAQALKNARGEIEIVLDKVSIEPEPKHQVGELEPGNYVRLRVHDSGDGVPEEIRERIFEPYFTTKNTGEGTGLGLSVVYGIVKNCGGEVLVESEPGRGTTFSVYFPVSAKEAPVHHEPSSDIPQGSERILFVDDEPAIVKLTATYLGRLGYKVTAVQRSQEALELFRGDPHRFDLVVTDMTMPQMTGDELATAMLSIRADIPIILCTGYSSQVSEHQAAEIGIRDFVLKPFTRYEMAAAIRRALDS